MTSKSVLPKQDYQKLIDILNDLLERQEADIFKEPVNYELLGLTDYPKIIKKPMDLGTVKSNLENGFYKSSRSCLDDIQLIWDNCMLYNMEGSDIHKIAKTLEEETSILVQENFGEFEYGKNNPAYKKLQE